MKEIELALSVKRWRRQVTLFVPGAAAGVLEPIRQRLDPIQHGLIPAHVTLCRDDEIGELPLTEFEVRLAQIALPPLTLQFGPPELFAGHGILLPCIAGMSRFQQLRVVLLGPEATGTRHAHITLAHPRNPRAPGNVIPTQELLTGPLTIKFATVSLIEQTDGLPWQVRSEYDFPAMEPVNRPR